MATPIRIGTRGSQLALWQANYVASELRARGHAVELEVIRTVGDRMQNAAFVADAADVTESGLSPNGTGIFIKELEDALVDHRIDVAVHSLKGPSYRKLIQGLMLAAIPGRADARDAFVCENFWGLHTLPDDATVATTSPRRKAMLLALRPDLRFVDMRGNIDTRLRKWAAGEADALVLACAGLDRLGRTEHVHQRFAIDEVTPAPGQGALAVQVRAHVADGDASVHLAVAALNDPATAFATQAERAALHALGGGCQLPLGAYCHAVDGFWHLHAMVAAPDGDEVVQHTERAPEGISAAELGERTAAALTELGARGVVGPGVGDSAFDFTQACGVGVAYPWFAAR